MINPINKNYSIAIYLSSLFYLSHANLSECEVPPYLYSFNSLAKYKTRAYMSSHMGHTSPRETIITYDMILH